MSDLRLIDATPPRTQTLEEMRATVERLQERSDRIDAMAAELFGPDVWKRIDEGPALRLIPGGPEDAA